MLLLLAGYYGSCNMPLWHAALKITSQDCTEYIEQRRYSHSLRLEALFWCLCIPTCSHVKQQQEKVQTPSKMSGCVIIFLNFPKAEVLRDQQHPKKTVDQKNNKTQVVSICEGHRSKGRPSGSDSWLQYLTSPGILASCTTTTAISPARESDNDISLKGFF